MLQRTFILSCLLLFIGISCSSDDAETAASACELVDCAPASLALQFVSNETGEDLLFNGTFAVDSLQITNVATNEAIAFSVNNFATSEGTIITLPTFVESSDSENYLISIPESFEIPFNFAVEVIDGPCCLGNLYSDVTIDATDVGIQLTDFGIYQLLF